MNKSANYFSVLDSIRASGNQVNSNMSNIVLFKDYIARIILWRKQLGKTETLTLRFMSGHDIISMLDPSYQDRLSMEELDNDLHDYNYNNSGRTLELQFIKLFMDWLIYKETHEVGPLYDSLLDPYESLIKFFQRRGGD